MTGLGGQVLVQRPSPNHGARPDGCLVDMLVLHYTGMRTSEEALRRLCEAQAEVSAHYLIDEDGTALQLVDESRRAWHAGQGSWAGESDINSCSIGIELVNPGHAFGYRPFPETQMRTLEAVCLEVLARHPIPAHRVLGHSDVAAGRKEDPGELFDWPRLARAGIGIWPERQPVPDRYTAGSMAKIKHDLSRIGYAVEASGEMDCQARSALLAFQRHWLADQLTGAGDPATAWRLQEVLKASPISKK
jgi:N-acetylmuramoyl-L-alanine amidase